MIIEITLGLIIVVAVAIIISSLPLYFSVKLLGGEATILKVFLTNILVAILSAVLMKVLGFGGLVVLFFTILLYSSMFEIGLIKSFFAWFIQYVIAFLLVLLIFLFLGIGLIV